MKQQIRTLLMLSVGLCLGQVQADSVRNTPVVAVVQKALPCVVNIGTERRVSIQYEESQRQSRGRLFDRLMERYWGAAASTGTINQIKQALGSGVVIHSAGYILTNFHVTERASKISVTFSDGRSYEARFVAGDEASDLALLKIEAGKPLPWLDFAADDDYLLGELMIAMGNPFGLGQTVTAGILSARNREAKYEGRVLFNDILQTDAAINPGSSGGPLLNADAQLVGINVATYEEGQNIGFAIPSVRVKELLTAWMSPLLLGNIALGFKVGLGDPGVIVTEVDKAQSPIKLRDQILSVNGVPVDSIFSFYRTLLPVKADDTLHLLVRRDGRDLPVDVTIVAVSAVEGIRMARERLGLHFASRVSVTGEGLVIAEVTPGSPADLAGLKAGNVIVRMDGMDVTHLEDLATILDVIKPGEAVELVVLSLNETSAEIRAQSFLKVLKVR
jgi:S1-C subfamily serine protease